MRLLHGTWPLPATGAGDVNGDGYADWEPSCGGTESSWAIYEGSLGDFTSHVPVHCASVQGASLIPRADDAYYLVVPRSLDFEGSYGKTSSGVERPASAAACRPQSILACP
jgi:hypothetical protein